MDQGTAERGPQGAVVSRRALIGLGSATAIFTALGLPLPAFSAPHPVLAGMLWNHPFASRYPVFPGGHFESDYYCTDAAGTQCAPRSSIGAGIHTGVDYSPSLGTPIYSVAAGTVSLVSTQGSWGYHVEVHHGNGVRTTYAHMQAGSINVTEGQPVGASHNLGNVGKTGTAKGAHLHLVLTLDGIYQNADIYVGEAPLAGSPGAPFTPQSIGDDLIIFPPMPVGSTDGVIPGGIAFIMDGSNGGAMRPLTPQEYSIYTSTKTQIPYREVLWNDANEVRRLSKTVGVMQYTGVNDGIRLTGKVIYDNPATADYPKVRAMP